MAHRLAFVFYLIHTLSSVYVVISDDVSIVTRGHIEPSSSVGIQSIRTIQPSFTAGLQSASSLGSAITETPSGIAGLSRVTTQLATASVTVAVFSTTPSMTIRSDSAVTPTRSDVPFATTARMDVIQNTMLISEVTPTRTLLSDTQFHVDTSTVNVSMISSLSTSLTNISHTSIVMEHATSTSNIQPSSRHIYSSASVHHVSSPANTSYEVEATQSLPQRTISAQLYQSYLQIHSTNHRTHIHVSNKSTSHVIGITGSLTLIATDRLTQHYGYTVTTLTTGDAATSNEAGSYTLAMNCSISCISLLNLSQMIFATRSAILTTISPSITPTLYHTASVQGVVLSTSVFPAATLIDVHSTATTHLDMPIVIEKRTQFTATRTISSSSETPVAGDVSVMTVDTTVIPETSPSTFPDDTGEEGTEVTTPSFKDIRIKIVFEGNCHRLRASVQLQMEFWQSLLSVIALKTQTTMLRLSTSDLKPFDMSCYPFSVVFEVKNIVYDNLINVINDSIIDSHFTVPILDEMTLVEYDAISVYDVTHIDIHRHKEATVKPDVKHVDVVVMVIAAVMFALMLCLGAIICCRECYKRKRAASFNLLDVPPANIKFEDYALTRIPRSRMIYHDHNASSHDTNASNSSKTNGRSLNIPLKDFTGRRKQRDQVDTPVHAGDIHIRTHSVADGLMVGVTCTPPSSPVNDKSTSGSTSPDSEGVDPSTQHLLGSAHSDHGTSNPNFRSEDGQQRVSRMYLIREDEMEQML